MATFLENLTTARDEAAERLAEIMSSPKPTYNIDGQSVSWTDYQRMLMESIKTLGEQINAAQPYEELSQGYS